MKTFSINKNGQSISSTFKHLIFMVILFIGSVHLQGQQVEIEWDGTELDLIRFIEDGLAQFVINGTSIGDSVSITFKIRANKEGKLTSALTLLENGFIKIHHVVDTLSHAQDSTAGNMVVLPDGTLAQRKYMIGDTTRGGLVFWVDETGEHGLVCAFVDQGVNLKWGPSGNETGAKRNNIYSGMMNTERIIINQGINNYAADRCAQYNGAGYGDWYLPSRLELSLMWKNLHRFGCSNVPVDNSPCPSAIGDFASEFYWSSTEDSGFLAEILEFDGGFQGGSNKLAGARARAVRAF